MLLQHIACYMQSDSRLFNVYPNVYPEPEKGRILRFKTRIRGRAEKQKELTID